MDAIGGPVQDVSIKGRLFAVAEDADMGRKIGGFENEIQMNGDGTARIIKTRVPWMLDGIALEVNDDRGDQEFLQNIADGNEVVNISATLASDATWEAKGTITGELKFSTKNATASVTLSGGGKMRQQ